MVITTESIIQDADEMREIVKLQRSDDGDMYQDLEPEKKAKSYIFYMGDVEDITEYVDEKFGDICILKKRDGERVPVIMDHVDLFPKYLEFYSEKT